MSPAVAAFLRDLLRMQNLNVGSPDFPQTAAIAQQALVELDAILEGEPGD